MSDENSQEPVITFKEFFEGTPPGRWAQVNSIATTRVSQYGTSYPATLPELELHCSTEACNGIRFFSPQNDLHFTPKKWKDAFVSFQCKNCGKAVKTFALFGVLSEDKKNGKLYKLGEYPSFGPPIPSRLMSLIGPERDYFLKGRRSENQGLGIAAFAYYRRVIENQKNRILDEIIKVSEKLSAAQEVIDDLVRAKEEGQFSKAVDAVKHGIPQTLLINGHNPLTLLHSALSEGLHAQTDEQCLELATSIRVVMSELADRLSQALKDEAELNSALGRLLNKRTDAS